MEKRGRGRPKGSKNKVKIGKQAEVVVKEATKACSEKCMEVSNCENKEGKTD